MTSTGEGDQRVTDLVMDCHDPEELARFWSAVFGSTGIDRDEEDPFSGVGIWGGWCPLPITFLPVPEAKAGKNRLHLDIRPPLGGSQAEEVDRLLKLGAARVDVGQGDVPWVVLADPEGNEFCILGPHPESAAATESADRVTGLDAVEEDIEHGTHEAPIG